MKNILEDDVEAFKKFLKIIELDEEFYSYGRNLLDMKREPKLKAMLEYRKECERRLKQMQKEVDKYTL